MEASLPERPNSYAPEKESPGLLFLYNRRNWPKISDDCSLEEALEVLITCHLVDWSHEITEWLRVNGELVFDGHPGDTMFEDKMWDKYAATANVLAKTILKETPRATS